VGALKPASDGRVRIGSFSLVDDGQTTEEYSHEYKAIGQFKLIRQVGVGAYGSVWMATDTELDRKVAVKIPRKGHLSAKESEQFLREARAAAQLEHANVVRVYEVGREDGQVYIASEFVEGVTLADRLEAGPLSSREAAELTAGRLLGSHTIHGRVLVPAAGEITLQSPEKQWPLSGHGRNRIPNFWLG
jgi:serine/threonine protein kinase